MAVRFRSQKIEGEAANIQTHIPIKMQKHIKAQAIKDGISMAALVAPWIHECYERDSVNWSRIKK